MESNFGKNDELFRPEAPAQKGILGKLQALGQQLGISKKPSRNSDFDVFIAEQFVKSDLVSKDRVLKLP